MGWSQPGLDDWHQPPSNGGSVPVLPENYGAAADGTTDDTAALQAWIASGKNLALTPGKTYLHRQELDFTTAGQILDGRGATIKRAAQGVTTTTTAITSGVTNSITVADATQFKVGDPIVVEQGGTYDTTARKITGIVGSVVTISGTFGVSLSGTTNVRTGWNQVLITAAGVRITNVQFDGNSANWSWARWQHSCAVRADTGCDRSMVDRCHIFNQYGDGASPGNYQTFWFAYNIVENIKGRGISWAGSSSPTSIGGRCLYNRFYNCDLDANVAANDGNGNIQVSSYTSDLLIHGNVCDTGISGIGSLDSTGNSDITITGNVIRSMTSYAIEGDNPSGDAASNVVIVGNRFYNCVTLKVSEQASGSSVFPSHWLIADNLFSNTSITGNYSQHLTIEGNTFVGGGTTLAYINLGSPKWLTVVGNDFEAGNYAIVVGEAFQAVSIRGNTMTGQHTGGILASYTGAGGSGMSIEGNTIEHVAGAIGGWFGIDVPANQNKVTVRSNSIVGGGLGCIVIGGNNCIVASNTCRYTSGTIVIQAGATTNYVLYNTVDAATIDGGTTTVITGEQVVA